MIDPDAAEAEKSLDKIKGICKVLNVVMRTLFVILLIFWCISTGSMIFSLMGPEPANGIGPLNVALCFAYGAVIAVMFFMFIGMFSDVSKESSPFTLSQVKRLRMIALMLLAYALLDFAGAYNSALLQLDTLNSGYITANSSAIVMVNFAPFIAAAVVFAFSFVFKYGVLLQEFSDDTV